MAAVEAQAGPAVESSSCYERTVARGEISNKDNTRGLLALRAGHVTYRPLLTGHAGLASRYFIVRSNCDELPGFHEEQRIPLTQNRFLDHALART